MKSFRMLETALMPRNTCESRALPSKQTSPPLTEVTHKHAKSVRQIASEELFSPLLIRIRRAKVGQGTMSEAHRELGQSLIASSTHETAGTYSGEPST